MCWKGSLAAGAAVSFSAQGGTQLQLQRSLPSGCRLILLNSRGVYLARRSRYISARCSYCWVNNPSGCNSTSGICFWAAWKAISGTGGIICSTLVFNWSWIWVRVSYISALTRLMTIRLSNFDFPKPRVSSSSSRIFVLARHEGNGSITRINSSQAS